MFTPTEEERAEYRNVWVIAEMLGNRVQTVTHELLGAAVAEARRQKLLSEGHFTVDGTLLEAWAWLKSFRLKDVC